MLCTPYCISSFGMYTEHCRAVIDRYCERAISFRNGELYVLAVQIRDSVESEECIFVRCRVRGFLALPAVLVLAAGLDVLLSAHLFKTAAGTASVFRAVVALCPIAVVMCGDSAVHAVNTAGRERGSPCSHSPRRFRQCPWNTDP